MDTKWWNLLGLALSILTYKEWGMSFSFCLVFATAVGLFTAQLLRTNNSITIFGGKSHCITENQFFSVIKTDTDKNCPGKPRMIQTCSTAITITWDPPTHFMDNDFYEVFFKKEFDGKNWTKCAEDFKTETATLTNLKSRTKFIFRVRVVHNDGEEGQYSAMSDVIETTASLAIELIQDCTIIGDTEPSPVIYALPLTEIKQARNVQAKIKKFDVRNRIANTAMKTKTIMLVGATGSGKTTLIDGIMNYILGVTWEDQFRFSIVDFDEREKVQKDEASSKTKWITCYIIYPEKGSRLNYQLQIIDTPTFGDTGGLKRDKEIIDQVRHLFSNREPTGISSIDAVCFLVKAPDQRLTPVQIYMFNQLMSLFGKDIKDNFCTLITFADGNEPPVLDALRKSELPFGMFFTFNNCALFTRNTHLDKRSLSPLFWSMGLSSFQAFFSHLDQFQTKSLLLTKDVLQERIKLEIICRNIQPTIEIGLDRLSTLKQHKAMLQKSKAEMEKCKDFEFEVMETQQKKTAIPGGFHITNCLNCLFTCHDRCSQRDDGDIRKCSIMDSNGNCKICPDKCKWNAHRSKAYRFEYITVKKKKTYSDLKARYETATWDMLSYESMVSVNETELKEISNTMQDMMFLFKECTAKLNQIALKPNLLSMTEHIDSMIENEKIGRKEGFIRRIELLNTFRKNAEIPQRIDFFPQEASVTLGPVVDTGRPQDIKAVFKRVNSWFKRYIPDVTF